MNRRGFIRTGFLGIAAVPLLLGWNTKTTVPTPEGKVRYTEVPPNYQTPEYSDTRLFGYYMTYRGAEIGRIVSVKESQFQSDPEYFRQKAKEILDWDRQRRMFAIDKKLAGIA